MTTTYLGAVQLKNDAVQKWTRPVYDAYLAGAWFTYWTDDTLYWVAKPAVHIEMSNGQRRLHCESGAAVESDVELLYFWHGVLVPAHVVVEPHTITVREIETEDNAEVRRVMIERYGAARYIVDSGAELIHKDDWGELYRKVRPDDSDLVMVKVVNSTPEPDGSFRDYWLRCNPELRPMLGGGGLGEPQAMTARAAVAASFGKRAEEYRPEYQT